MGIAMGVATAVCMCSPRCEEMAVEAIVAYMRDDGYGFSIVDW
jgi:hypothetical protein